LKSSFGRGIDDSVDDMAVGIDMSVVVGMSVGIESIRVGICFRINNPVEAEERIS
jgi:hypothetical protein